MAVKLWHVWTYSPGSGAVRHYAIRSRTLTTAKRVARRYAKTYDIAGCSDRDYRRPFRPGFTISGNTGMDDYTQVHLHYPDCVVC